MLMPAWNSIIRFKDVDGTVRYGEPSSDLKSARIWSGSDILSLSLTDETSEVVQVRARVVCVRAV